MPTPVLDIMEDAEFTITCVRLKKEWTVSITTDVVEIECYDNNLFEAIRRLADELHSRISDELENVDSVARDHGLLNEE